MTAYLKSLGMTEAVLSVFRGFGAISGVAATFAYPLLHRRLGMCMCALLISATQIRMPSSGRPAHLPADHKVLIILISSTVGNVR